MEEPEIKKPKRRLTRFIRIKEMIKNEELE
jgi:hypothetical protein